MKKAILAGIMISIGAIVNLTIGGIAGALFFSVGLLSILHFKLFLFTGKAGLLATGEITVKELVKVWCGNLIGTMLVACCYSFIPQLGGIQEAAAAIATVRGNNAWYVNLILGIFCGILMYVAVTGYNATKNVAFVIMPVAVFILAKFNHCVADMFYISLGAVNLTQWLSLLFTTIGNIIGCNLIPFLNDQYNLELFDEQRGRHND